MQLYRVQIGAYLLKKNAEKAAVKLIERGFKAAIIKENGLHKVQIGSFRDKANAEKLLKRAKSYKDYKNAKIMVFDDGKKEVVETPFHPLIRLVGIWLTESCEDKFGDAEVFIEYEDDKKTIAHAVLVDTGQNGTDTVKKLQKLGIKVLDAVIISHAHGDHYGYLSTIFQKFTVKHLYLPEIAGLQKYQPAYAKAIRNQEKKAAKLGIPVTYLTTGIGFTVGKIVCDCLYQVPAESLKEHDTHHFPNNQSTVLRFTLDEKVRVLLTGDLQNEGNNILMNAVSKEVVESDILKCGWHGDGNAMSEAFAKFVGALLAWWNYHHKESNGGRGNTRKKLEKANTTVLRNFEDGDIYFDCVDGEITVWTSKGTFKNKKYQAKKR